MNIQCTEGGQEIVPLRWIQSTMLRTLLLSTLIVAFLAFCLPRSLAAAESKTDSESTAVGYGVTEATMERATVEPEIADANGTNQTQSGYGNPGHFGGPKSVGSQLKTDDKVKKPLFTIEGVERALKPYNNFKKQVNEKIGLQFGGDYNVLLQDANRSMGEETACPQGFGS